MRRAILVAALALAALAAAATPGQARPTIDATCTPSPSSCVGWYNEPATVHWEWSPSNASVLAGCDSNDPVDFDTPSTTKYCRVRDPSDNVTALLEVPVSVDMTAPVVSSVAPSRAPDSNGWYRSPLQVSFSGTDALSGLAGCSSGTYSGPDAAAAQVTGRCWDRAGNVSAPGTLDLRYDAHAPPLTEVVASGRDHRARLEWDVPDAASFDVWRVGAGKKLVSSGPSGSLVDRGLRNGHRYEYVVRATDAAGNTAKRTLSVVPGPRLFGPPHGARLVAPPLLSWTSIRGADYYNVQLFRGRRKILSAWPTKPRVQLEESWRYAGHKRRLKPGKRYRWFVWPGEGPRSRNQYGGLIGARTFVMTP